MPAIRFNIGRPTAIERALADWAFRLGLDMQLEQRDRDFVASGQSLDAYEVVVEKPNEVQLRAADYIRFSVTGRGPGGFPPVSVFADWITMKGIPIPEGFTLNGLAFVMARKQAEEGNKVYRGERQGIPMQEIIERSFDETMPEAANLIAIEAANEILAGFQNSKNVKVRTYER